MFDAELSPHGNKLFLLDRRIPCDAALVFGMSQPERPALRAAELYHQGLAPRLIMSGGFNPRLGTSECTRMVMAARRAGVPPVALLCEDQARHTDENAEFSVRLLPPSCRSVLVITFEAHMRRALLAARRWLGPQIALGWCSYPSQHYSAQTWASSCHGRRHVASELEKIERYYKIAPDGLGAPDFPAGAPRPSAFAAVDGAP